MSKTYCKDCDYWDNSNVFNAKTEDEGYCHYWPPATIQNQTIGAIFPKTNAGCWCAQGQNTKANVLLHESEA